MQHPKSLTGLQSSSNTVLECVTRGDCYRSIGWHFQGATGREVTVPVIRGSFLYPPAPILPELVQSWSDTPKGHLCSYQMLFIVNFTVDWNGKCDMIWQTLRLKKKWNLPYTIPSPKAKIGSKLLLASTSSNTLLERGPEKAFKECLGVSNTFPLPQLSKCGYFFKWLIKVHAWAVS